MSCYQESQESEYLCSISDQLEVMRKKERTTYKYHDYIQQYEQDTEDYYSNNQSDIFDIMESRSKMCDWCFNVAEYCKFSEESAGQAISLMDLYLCTDSPGKQTALTNIAEFQLLAMTALQISVKMNEDVIMDIDTLIMLSNNQYTENDFECMEMELLSALKWQINVSTPYTFVDYYLELLLPSVSNNKVKDNVRDSARYQVELALCDYKTCITVMPSEIAIAAICNSFFSEIIASQRVQKAFARTIKIRILSEGACNRGNIMATRSKLHQLLQSTENIIDEGYTKSSSEENTVENNYNEDERKKKVNRNVDKPTNHLDSPVAVVEKEIIQ